MLAAGAAAWLGTSASEPLLNDSAAAISLGCERPELGFSGKKRQLFSNISSILPPIFQWETCTQILSEEWRRYHRLFEVIPTRCFRQMLEGASLFSEDPCKFSRYFLPLIFCFQELL